MLCKAKANYCVKLVKTQSINPKQLWTSINSLSGTTKSKVLPDYENLSTLVNSFNHYFTGKVTQMWANIGVGIIDHLDITKFTDNIKSNVSSTAQMSVF